MLVTRLHCSQIPLFLLAIGLPSTFTQANSPCAIPDYVSCNVVDAKLPAHFCCSPWENCISLDSSSSAYCCPTESNCTWIDPTSCNMTYETLPYSWVMTTRLNDSLPTCGSDGCCPFGYQADNTNPDDCRCHIIAETSFNISHINSAAASSVSTTLPQSLCRAQCHSAL